MEGAVLPPAGTTNRSVPDCAGLFRELMVLGAGALVYFGGRKVVEGSGARAVRDARWIIEFEQWLGIDVEHAVQRATDDGLLRTIGNLSYVWLHWPLLIVVLVVLFHRDRHLYRRLRDAMFASGAVSLVVFGVFPAAPPRFMPGFVGTVSDEARRHFVPTPLEWSNPYASFPSFHVGWTLIACLALAAALGRRRWAALAMAPAVLVGVAVVSTGNHYVVDAAAGAVIALVAYRWSGRRLAATSVSDTASSGCCDVHSSAGSAWAVSDTGHAGSSVSDTASSGCCDVHSSAGSAWAVSDTERV